MMGWVDDGMMMMMMMMVVVMMIMMKMKIEGDNGMNVTIYLSPYQRMSL